MSDEFTSRTHCVVTVHGIRTYGDWQARLKAILSNADPNIDVRSYVFGYFSIVAFVIPPFRWLVTRQFRLDLIRLWKENPAARIDLVGHSFGTHLIAWALKGIPQSSRPKINTVLLAASVLKADFTWNELLAEGTVRQVVNDCGIDDVVLLLNQLFVLFTGQAGRIGFTGMTGRSFHNRHFKGGHSLYFYKRKMASDEFMEKYWAPLLLQDSYLEVDERTPPSALGGIVQTIANNAGPIKLTIYTLLLLTPAYFFYSLYSEAESQRLAAIEQTRVANQANVQLLKTLESLMKQFVPFQITNDETIGSWNESNIRMLREVISRMEEYRLSSLLRMTVFVGRYCRDKDGVILAGQKSLSKCVGLGPSNRSDVVLATSIADALKTRLMSEGLVAGSIELDMSINPIDPGKTPYPQPEKATIDDWNRAASLNTRIEFDFLPNTTLQGFLGYPGQPTNFRIEVIPHEDVGREE